MLPQGFTALEARLMGLRPKELKEGGFDLEEIKMCGYTPWQLRDSFPSWQLVGKLRAPIGVVRSGLASFRNMTNRGSPGPSRRRPQEELQSGDSEAPVEEVDDEQVSADDLQREQWDEQSLIEPAPPPTSADEDQSNSTWLL